MGRSYYTSNIGMFLALLRCPRALLCRTCARRAPTLQGIVLQVDFKPTTKNTPEEHYAVLNKVGHALPTSADAAVEEAAPASASAPVQGEQCSAPSKGKGGGSKKLHIVDTGGEEVSASLEAYLARKAARSTPSAKNAKKGSDQGRRAASASAREPLSDDDLDRLGTRLREER